MSQPFVNSTLSWNRNTQKKQKSKDISKYHKVFQNHQQRLIPNLILYSITQNQSIHTIHRDQYIKHQKKKKYYQSDRNKKCQQSPTETKNRHFQLLLRCSLKKGQTAKIKSREQLLDKQEHAHWLAKSSSKVAYMQGQIFPELYGKKCKINRAIQTRYTNSNKYTKTKKKCFSQSKCHQKCQQWVQNASQQSDDLLPQDNSLITLEISPKKKNQKQQKSDLYYIIQAKRNKINKDKVVLFSSNCFIVNNTNNKNVQNNDYKNQTKSNIRQKKQYIKKIPKLQTQLLQKQQNITQPKFFCLRSHILKNSFNKSFYCQEIGKISQAFRKPKQYKQIIKMIKKQSNLKTLQNGVKITGWEVNNPEYENID